MKISALSDEITKKGDGVISHPRAIAQKQPGLYAVSYHPAGGSPEPSLFRKLYDAIEEMEEVEIRLSPDEGMYLINCTETASARLASEIPSHFCGIFLTQCVRIILPTAFCRKFIFPAVRLPAGRIRLALWDLGAP